MNKTLEDTLGKIAMLAAFGYLCYGQLKAFVGAFAVRDQIPLWPLALFSQFCGALFFAFILLYTATRLPPRDSAAGLMPRFAAIAGTFIMLLLVVLPPEPISPTLRVISTVIIIVGTCLSIYCLTHLGRSFSMMATSRELRTRGSYALVRHPLYAAEMILILGVVLAHGSPIAFAIGAVWLVLQITRARYEEGILRQTFPEYDAYARRVPMLIPGLRLPGLDHPR